MKDTKIRQNMIWKATLNSIQFCLYLVGICLSIVIAWKIGTAIGSNNWPPTIEKIASWSQVLVAYAALFAVGQYLISYIDIADKKTKNVLEYVKFFRESIIPSGNIIRKHIKEKKISLTTRILIRKNTPPPSFTEDEYFEKIEPNQRFLIELYKDIIVGDSDLEEKILNCLNASEELAIGLINSNSVNHPAVTSIRRPFVQIIEEFSIPLYFYIGVRDDRFYYSSELYRQWKKHIGFIPSSTKEREEYYTDKIKRYKSNSN